MITRLRSLVIGSPFILSYVFVIGIRTQKSYISSLKSSFWNLSWWISKTVFENKNICLWVQQTADFCLWETKKENLRFSKRKLCLVSWVRKANFAIKKTDRASKKGMTKYGNLPKSYEGFCNYVVNVIIMTSPGAIVFSICRWYADLHLCAQKCTKHTKGFEKK